MVKQKFGRGSSTAVCHGHYINNKTTRVQLRNIILALEPLLPVIREVSDEFSLLSYSREQCPSGHCTQVFWHLYFTGYCSGGFEVWWDP